MAISLPTTTPYLSLVMPEVGIGQNEVELTNGQTLWTDSGGVVAYVDDVGTYLTLTDDTETVNLSPITDNPDAISGVSEIIVRIAARTITPLWEEAGEGYVSRSSAEATTLDGRAPVSGIRASRTGVGEPSPSVLIRAEDVSTDASYRELRLRVSSGGDIEWQTSGAVEGEGSGQSGTVVAGLSFDDPIVVGLSNLSLNTNPEFVNPEKVRLYRYDVWVNPSVGGGYWTTRQRQTAGGNTGGWPLRQRHNGGHSGSWPLRQRQTGL